MASAHAPSHVTCACLLSVIHLTFFLVRLCSLEQWTKYYGLAVCEKCEASTKSIDHQKVYGGSALDDSAFNTHINSWIHVCTWDPKLSGLSKGVCFLHIFMHRNCGMWLQSSFSPAYSELIVRFNEQIICISTPCFYSCNDSERYECFNDANC